MILLVFLRRKFKILRFLVLQFPIVHVLLLIGLNVIAIDSPHVVVRIVPFFGPFLLSTVLLGVWAFQITIRMITPYHQSLNLLKKFISFQLVLIFCKLQPLLIDQIVKLLMTFGDCHASLHHVFIVCHSELCVDVQFFELDCFFFLTLIFLALTLRSNHTNYNSI